MIISDADTQRFDLEKVDEIYRVQNSLLEGKPPTRTLVVKLN